MNTTLKTLPASIFLILVLALALSTHIVSAQTPGEWKYQIRTDPSSIPVEAINNFPPTNFSICRSAEDFTNGTAFGVQARPSSTGRCTNHQFIRKPAPENKGESIEFQYACDDGKTLTGSATGRVQNHLFTVQLKTQHTPPVDGISLVQQTMTGRRIGPCKQP